MGRRIVCVWLPRFAAERALRREPALLEAPFAVLAEERQALRVRSVNGVAEAAGVRRGQGAADARALCPSLATRPADPNADALALDGVIRWARRYTPWVGQDRDAAPGEAGLALDVTGCAHLFGGEDALLRDLTGRLTDFGLTARAALADAKGAAWALARAADGAPPAETTPPIAAPGETRAAIAPMPIDVLRLSDTAIGGLNRLGVKTIEDLLRLPRAALGRRFGAETLRRLDQALGAEPEPVAPQILAPNFAVRLSLPEPIGTRTDVAAGLDRLLTRLCAALEDHAMGARRLRLTVRRVDRGERSLEIGLARPGRDPRVIAPLFDRGLDDLDAGYGIDALRLAALQTEPLSETQSHAGPDRDDPRARDALDGLLTRLGGRVGFDGLTRPLPADTHNPDRATIWAPATLTDPARDWAAQAAARPPRPLIRFPPEPLDRPEPGRPPARFRWRGAIHTLETATGPERLAPEWWLDDPDWRDGVRDYWRIETAAGLRLWLFETPQVEAGPRWWAAGLFP